MPLRESEKAKYPPAKEWKALRARILARAKSCCKWCGVPNGRLIVRWPDGSWTDGFVSDEGRHFGGRDVKIVLTIAHLDHNPANNAGPNLAALCQRCHLSHDVKEHAFNGRRTRARKAGQAEMGFVLEREA